MKRNVLQGFWTKLEGSFANATGKACITWARMVKVWSLWYMGEGHFSAAVSAPDTSAPFPNLFLFFKLWRKNNEAGNFLNAVEREPVETRVLNPTASEASYKPKQRSCRTTNLKKKFWRRIVPAPKCPALGIDPCFYDGVAGRWLSSLRLLVINIFACSLSRSIVFLHAESNDIFFISLFINENITSFARSPRVRI